MFHVQSRSNYHVLFFQTFFHSNKLHKLREIRTILIRHTLSLKKHLEKVLRQISLSIKSPESLKGKEEKEK